MTWTLENHTDVDDTAWLNNTDEVRRALEERMRFSEDLSHYQRSRRIAFAAEVAWLASRLAQLEALDGGIV